MHAFIVKSCIQIIGTLPNCPAISTVTVSCKEWFWDRVAQALIEFKGRRSQFQRHCYCSAFTGVCALRLILERTLNCHRDACSPNSGVSSEYLGWFELPMLVDLTQKIVPVRNRILDAPPSHSPVSRHSDHGTGYYEKLYDGQASDSESTLSMSECLMSDTAWRSDNNSRSS
jgi:hypothetical protein